MNQTETRIISKHDETFDIIKSAVDKMVNVIRPTFGPASNKVIVSKVLNREIIDDGVRIAQQFELPDPAENAVVKIILEVASRTNDKVGDGTTGSLIMLQAIINEVARRGHIRGRYIERELRQGLEDAKLALRKSAKEIKTKEDLKKVAMIAFDYELIAEMIADLYYKLGKDATITIDKSPTAHTSSETTDGIKLATGYISPYMINRSERMESELEKPYILLTNYRLTENTDLFPIIEKMAAAKKGPLFIIAENVEQQALATLVINQPHVVNPQTRQLGSFLSCAIALPKVENRDVLLEDLALLTGAKVFSAEKGDKLESAELEDLGRAERIICRREETIIIGPKGKKVMIKQAVESLKQAIESETNESAKNTLKYRLGMFTNTMAVVRVGAFTDNERKALKEKVEDAVNAVRSAYKGGVVCGGGLALARLNTSSPILNEALKYPARQLAMNSEDGSAIVPEKLDERRAYNYVTGEAGLFMDVGVVDSVEALIAGIESAVSIATTLLTCSGMIVESQKKPQIVEN